MYQKKISSTNPGHIVLAIDDSRSVDRPFTGTTDSIFQWIERYFFIIIKLLLARSTDVQGDATVIKPRYYLTVIQYGSNPQIWGDPLMDIETAVKKHAENNSSLGLGGHLGGTNAKAAFEKVHEVLSQTIQDERFSDSFPPLIFHLTDGESHTDATPVIEKIQNLSTTDGNPLIVNAYIGTQTNLNYDGPENFPGYMTEQESGPSDDNIRLFHMSSKVPECIHQNLVEDGIFPELREESHLFFDVRTKDMLKHVIQVVSSIGVQTDRTER